MKNILLSRFVVLIIIAFFTTTIHLNAQSGAPFVQGEYVFYYPKLSTKNQGFDKVKANLSEVLNNVRLIYDIKNNKEINPKDIKGILVLDDRIEIETKSKKDYLTLYFPRLIDSTMFFYGFKNTWYYVYCPSLVNFVFADLNNAQILADNIYFIQYPLINKRRDSLINIFEPIALQYKSSMEKPSISEEQRKLFVQADMLTKQNNYMEALKVYNKAIELDPTSFPSAYSNLALLYAQTNFFDYAILCMKKYLMLEPEAMDARGAQDKIYEWEGIIGK